MMTTAKVSVPGPYKIVDMVSSWKARMKTSAAALTAAAVSGGSTTVRAAAAGRAPLSRAARVRPGGSRSRAACTGRWPNTQNFATYATPMISAEPSSQRP